MTTLAEARAELAQIAERQAALQKIVDAAPKSLLTKPVAGSSKEYWALNADCGGRFAIKEMAAHNPGPLPYEGGNIFTDDDTAASYADALDTLLMLRHQPGTEAPADYRQWLLRPNEDFDGIYVDDLLAASYKLERIVPCFNTKVNAQAALDVIGFDRILRMFRTLHGVTA